MPDETNHSAPASPSNEMQRLEYAPPREAGAIGRFVTSHLPGTSVVLHYLWEPIARATATHVSFASALIDSAIYSVNKKWPSAQGLTAKVADHLGFNDIVLDRHSRMGRPRLRPANALLFGVGALAAVPGIAVGRLALFLTDAGIVNLDPAGHKVTKAHAKATKQAGNAQINLDGSDFAPTPALTRRMGLSSLNVGGADAQVGATAAQIAARQNIKHLVVVTQENHTIANLPLAGVGYDPTLPVVRTDRPAYTYPWIPTHGNWSWHHRRFMMVYEQYDPALSSPFHDRMARTYAGLRDYHASTRGPSHANHMFARSSNANGLLDNPHTPVVNFLRRVVGMEDPVAMPVNVVPIEQRLEAAGETWGDYGDGAGQSFADIKDSPNNLPAAQFEQDARSGKLRTVSWVVAPEFKQNEHSPDSMWDGQQWVADHVVKPIVDGGEWKDTAILVMYDDFGGYVSETEPTHLENWQYDKSVEYSAAPKVPAYIMSPYAKAGYIFDPTQETDHTKTRHHGSIPAFIEWWKGLAPLGDGTKLDDDVNADDLSGAFDFTQQPLPPPDTSLAPKPHNTNWDLLRADFKAARAAKSVPQVTAAPPAADVHALG